MLFYLGQEICRRVFDSDLRVSYIEDENVRILPLKLTALAFLPSQLVNLALEQLDELRHGFGSPRTTLRII